MAALAGVVHRPLGHERRDSLVLREEHLAERLEERGTVGGVEAVRRGEGAFPHAGTGLAVQSFQGRVDLCAVVHQPPEQVGVARGPQHRVAEVAGRERAQVAVVLLAYGVGRLVEDEELVLEARLQREAVAGRAVQGPAQRRARTDGVVVLSLRDELPDEVGHALVRQPALGVDHEPVVGVREPGVPAGERAAVVQFVRHVPAEDAVAETAALGEEPGEFIEAHVLAANDSVDVREAQLDLPGAPFAIALELRRHLIRHCAVPLRGVPAHGRCRLFHAICG